MEFSMKAHWLISCLSSLPCVHGSYCRTQRAGARRCTTGRGCAERRIDAQFSRSAQRGAAARLVALDERQHLHGRHQARSRMDASRGRGRRDHLRRRHQHAAGGAAAADLYDAGVEAGIQLRGDHGAQHGYGSGHRQFAGMERDRRAVGSRVAGHEEDGVVRDAR